jgi:hypothetical protein
MFVVCAMVLVVVSLMTPPPARRTLAGLTFATVDDKLETRPVAEVRAVPKESRAEHQLNLAFTGLLLLTVIGLWIYFR